MAMRCDVRDAIQSARTVGRDGNDFAFGAKRYRSAEATRAIVLAVAQELPSDMTMAELIDELCIANNQGPLR